MANHTVSETAITVHGRGSLILPFNVKDSEGAQIDISGWTVYFEVDGVPIREQLATDPNDALGLRIVLERAQVETLPTAPVPFAVIDESQSGSDLYTVLWEGTIGRTGFKGAPDSEVG